MSLDFEERAQLDTPHSLMLANLHDNSSYRIQCCHHHHHEHLCKSIKVSKIESQCRIMWKWIWMEARAEENMKIWIYLCMTNRESLYWVRRQNIFMLVYILIEKDSFSCFNALTTLTQLLMLLRVFIFLSLYTFSYDMTRDDFFLHFKIHSFFPSRHINLNSIEWG